MSEIKKPKLPTLFELGYGTDGTLRKLVPNKEIGGYIVVDDKNVPDYLQTCAIGMLWMFDDKARQRARELGLTDEEYAFKLGHLEVQGQQARTAQRNFDLAKTAVDRCHKPNTRAMDD